MTLGMRAYADQVQTAIASIDLAAVERIVDVLEDAFHAGRRVFMMGNGASAALASHMACDLGKGTALDVGQGVADAGLARLKVISLVDNTALLSAISNDVSYQDVFVEQLKNLLEAGDVVIGISGSGGSPNVLRAMQYARARGATTIGLTGHQPSSRFLCALSDIVVQVPLTIMEQIEDVHVIMHHMITTALRERIATGRAVKRRVAHGHRLPRLDPLEGALAVQPVSD
ncbi:MAG TPA: SIS domain-containing protein [Thermomicrobiales bacterium]|nr:SIS domain-containing protein [Thermomicrobiales bacterium]